MLTYNIELAANPLKSETVNPATTPLVVALAREIRTQFDEDLLKEDTVENKELVATVASLLVPTVGPVAPIFAIADKTLLKPLVTSLVRALIAAWTLEIDAERSPLVLSVGSTETVLSLELAMYMSPLDGAKATPLGPLPTLIGIPTTKLVDVSITETVL